MPTEYPTVLKIERFILRNQWGWRLIYEMPNCGPDWDTVTIRKVYRGEPVGEFVMTRDEARQHYAVQLRAGFVSKNTTF